MEAASDPMKTIYSNDEDLLELLAYSFGEGCFPVSGLSNDLKIGFFKTDHATQTDESEILALKELSDSLASVFKEIHVVKRDLECSKMSLEAGYDLKMQEQSLVLYKRMNDQITVLETLHRQKIQTLCSSFKQQLSDALTKMKAEYKKYYAKLAEEKRMKVPGPLGMASVKLKEKDFIIASLKAKVADFEDLEENRLFNFEMDEDAEKELILIQNEELKNELNYLLRKNEQLTDILDMRDEQIQDLDTNFKKLKIQNETVETAVQKFMNAEEKLKKELESEKIRAKQLLEEQKSRMDGKLFATMMKMEARDKAAKDIELTLKAKEALIAKQKSYIIETKESKDTKETKEVKETHLDTSQALLELKLLKKLDKQQKELILGLNKELQRTNQAWEKKFNILRRSLFAVKDEMFMRCSMQRQTASIRNSNMNYAPEDPVGIVSQANQSLVGSPYMPLPQIGSSPSQLALRTNVDKTSSGSALGIFNLTAEGQKLHLEGKFQVSGDQEEALVSEIAPFPSPPQRQEEE
ncbi:uncharacterized protein C10orf67 homolog, mitochondrial isoform X2 [Callorhinchus milii]|uniref:uncharacterized protein C10orf67 homolog, mitochondrial isoform X2 n=1 Tax=Callorhinchus milii TaxID=7868 RepID=UPI00045762C3|nr:uncharacterized protein C10orf67 homolog, mitochondrial isoform X2 [Callorhinchus milii]|eukprot:gi/632945190/ref/XP_007887915.1/ PREDICTED: uncharacterized protein C10orf67 homolog isoform X2 [Callorhinchus milii]